MAALLSPGEGATLCALDSDLAADVLRLRSKASARAVAALGEPMALPPLPEARGLLLSSAVVLPPCGDSL
jgi:hypothetical protein